MERKAGVQGKVQFEEGFWLPGRNRLDGRMGMGVLRSNLVQNKKAEKQCQEGSAGERENGECNFKQFALATVGGRATVQYTRRCCVDVLVRTTPWAKMRLRRFALDRTGSWTVAATIKWPSGESSQR
jgi:hypothetical protein